MFLFFLDFLEILLYVTAASQFRLAPQWDEHGEAILDAQAAVRGEALDRAYFPAAVSQSAEESLQAWPTGVRRRILILLDSCSAVVLGF